MQKKYTYNLFPLSIKYLSNAVPYTTFYVRFSYTLLRKTVIGSGFHGSLSLQSVSIFQSGAATSEHKKIMHEIVCGQSIFHYYISQYGFTYSHV